MTKFLLRPWQEEDLKSLCNYANNIIISSNLTNRFPYPYTESDGKKFIQMAMSKLPTQIFCIEIQNEAAGGIGIHSQEDIFYKNAELGYWLAEKHWGQGIITDAIHQVCKYTFNNLPIERIFARPFDTNIPSQKVLEKNNFKLEARLEKTIFKNGEYKDELIYAIRKKDFLK
ncbi:MAG: GNAT family N-acetyltransferase [Saprospiraceae bacterium]|nr:GNAT family N-acetyltransferase [Saprospiraceae bacterium]